MDIFEILRLSLNSLRTNKVRSFLTMLGIIIGVFSVILLVSIGNGLQDMINKQFENLGTNIIIIMPGKLLDEQGQYAGNHGPPNFAGSKLTLSHVDGLRRLGNPIKDAAGRNETPITASIGKGKTIFTTLIGITGNYSSVRNTNSQSGRFITQNDVNSGKRVVAIGPSLSEKLFNGENPIGKNIRLGDNQFKVIGVVEKKGGGFGVDADNSAYVPLTTIQRIMNLTNIQVIDVEVNSKDSIKEAIKVINTYMNRRLKEDEFSVLDQSQLLSTINVILGAVTTALGAIAAISLFVGGIGIMNIMLVSVTERTHEIGLRKAIGARPKDIAIQFLIEAVFLSLTGGIIGILLSIPLTAIIKIIISRSESPNLKLLNDFMSS